MGDIPILFLGFLLTNVQLITGGHHIAGDISSHGSYTSLSAEARPGRVRSFGRPASSAVAHFRRAMARWPWQKRSLMVDPRG